MRIESIKKRILALGTGDENFAFFNIHVCESESIIALYSGDNLFIKKDFYSSGLHTFSEKIYTYENGQFKLISFINQGGKQSKEEQNYPEHKFMEEIEYLLTLAEELGDCYEQFESNEIIKKDGYNK